MTKKEYIHLLKPFVTTIILVFLYAFLHALNIPFITVSKLKTQDFLWRVKHTLSQPPSEVKQIVFVSIDDSAYNQYGGKWPWGREAFAALIYNINKDSPKIIGLNLAFLGITERQEVDDQMLRLAFVDAGNVIGASYFGTDGSYITPNEYFTSALKDYGFTNKPIDIDNIIRYTKLFEPFQISSEYKVAASGILDYSFEIKLLTAYFSLSTENIFYDNNKLTFVKVRAEGSTLARGMEPRASTAEFVSPGMPQQKVGTALKDGGKPAKSLPGALTAVKNKEHILEIPVDKQGLTFINYTVLPSDLNIVPVLNVLYNKIPPKTFTDKIVLIGTKGKIFHEEISTPLGLLSGIEIIANSLTMILSKRFIFIAPFYCNAIFLTLLASLLSYWFWRFGIIKNLIILCALVIVYSIFSIILVKNDIIIDFFGIFTLLIISYFAIETLKYSTLLIEEIKLKNMATLDSSTGLSTRRYFLYQLESNIQRSLKEHRNLSIALFSIDNYESIATKLNIEKTDLLLKKVAHIIKKNSRKTRSGDLIARYGEALFSIIFRNTSPQGALRYAQRIKPLLEQTHIIQTEQEVKLNISIGITSLIDVPTTSALVLIKHAECALETAKHETNKIFLLNKTSDTVDLKKQEAPHALDEISLSFVAEELNIKNKELQELVKKLRTAYSEMTKNEKLSAMGKLASSIHHELNNPLSALRTCFQTINKTIEKQVDETSIKKTKELITMAIEEIERLIEMNKGLKDLYRPARITLEPVNINQLLHEIFLFLKGELNKRKIQLISNLYEGIPVIQGNIGDLKQSFLNIILNAADAMPQGGTLTITSRQQLVAIKEPETSDQIPTTEGNYTVISFTDTGCGIAPDNLDKIFEPLFTTKEGKGAGLGLYITKQKIEQLNGTIKVTSELNKGTTFIINLPS